MALSYEGLEARKQVQSSSSKGKSPLEQYPTVPLHQLEITLINTKAGTEIPVSRLHYGIPANAKERRM